MFEPGEKDQRLTPRQDRFVHEYLVDLNATQAAVRAGYAMRSADVTASRLLGNAKVGAAVRHLQGQTQERLEITRDTVVQGLHREATDRHSNGSARVQAWLGVAKVLGFLVDHRDVRGRVDVVHQLDNLTIDQLRSLAGQAQEAKTIIDGEAREVEPAGNDGHRNALPPG